MLKKTSRTLLWFDVESKYEATKEAVSYKGDLVVV